MSDLPFKCSKREGLSFLNKTACDIKRALSKEDLDRHHYKDKDFCLGCDGPVDTGNIKTVKKSPTILLNQIMSLLKSRINPIRLKNLRGKNQK